MNKAITVGIATLLTLAVATPALAKVQPGATASTTTSGVHMNTGTHVTKPVKKTVQGVIKETSACSFVITVRNTDYTVTAMTSARVINRVWKKIALSDIKVGDKVRVYGAITGTNITAEIVRDISLPTASQASEHATTIPTH